MLRFTDGPADEMSILIACGVATYVIAFPIIILCGIVVGGLIRAADTAAADAAPAGNDWGRVGAVHPKAGVSAGAAREVGVGAAA